MAEATSEPAPVARVDPSTLALNNVDAPRNAMTFA